MLYKDKIQRILQDVSRQYRGASIIKIFFVPPVTWWNL